MKVFWISLIAAVLFFLVLLALPGIPGGDDGYRHVAMAHQIATNWQDVRLSGWHLEYLWPRPVDIWFLYDLLLAPFTLILPLIVALKLYAALWLGATVYAFWLLLDAAQLRYRGFWLCLLLFGSWAFIMRLSLGRPLSASVFLLLLAAYYTLKRHTVGLTVVSAAFALAYSVFFLILIVPIAAVLAWRGTWTTWWLLLTSVAGVACGLLISPYFPENVKFGFVQAVIVPFVGAKNHLPIGTELRSMDLVGLASIGLVVVIWLLACWRYFSRRRTENFGQPAIFFLLLSAGNALLMIRMQRQLEYFVPFAILFAATVLQPLFDKVPWRENLRRLWRNPGKETATLSLLAGYAVLFISNFWIFVNTIAQSPPPDLFQGAAQYAAEQGGESALVFNSQWDEYPQLFFWNQQSHYLLGMDPAFLYIVDQKHYWLWWHISNDELLTCVIPRCEDNMRNTLTVRDAVFRTFGATYLLIEKRRTPMLWDALPKDPTLNQVYADENTRLYEEK